ncbi:hypothetical protein D3C81_1558380 [compost metagenome]
MIVPGIADRDRLCQLAAKMSGKEFESMSFSSFFMHNLKEMRLRFSNMNLISQKLTKYRCNLVQVVRIIDNEHFWCRLNDNLHKIRLNIIFGTIQNRIIDNLLVFLTRIKLIINVGLEVQVMLRAIFKQLGCCIDWQITLIKHLFIQQVFDKSPLISNDGYIKPCLTCELIGTCVCSTCSKSYNYSLCYGFL